MKERIRTLVFGADGFGPDAIREDTAFHLRLKRIHTGNRKQVFGGYGSSFSGKRFPYAGRRYEPLSYARDWEDAFLNNPHLDVDLCNATDLLTFRRHLKLIKDYDLIVVLHSAAGDDMSVIKKAVHALQRRRGKLAIFFGNEYDLMAEKIDFANRSNADFICSQLPIKAAVWLYDGVASAKILSIPHALNQHIYRPDRTVNRVLDIAFVGALYHSTIGDLERTHIINAFAGLCPKLGLISDIRFANLPRPLWSQYLRMTKAIVGAESGTYYLQRSGEAIRRSLNYQKENPDAPYEAVFRYAFADARDYINGKCISSRHFEPIGTRTCQILLEGEYNGILKPLEHYISVKKDHSNLDEALRLFADTSFRETMAARTHEYVMDCHTYDKRVQSLLHTALGA